MAASKVQFTFEITGADGTSRMAHLDHEMVKIGKHPSSHIVLDDDGVSRMHAYVEALPSGEVVIMDLGSLAGTFVNGEKLTKKRVLVSGDRIGVGGTTIDVWLDGAKGASAGTAAAKPLPPKPARAASADVPNAPARPAASAFAPMASPVAVAPVRGVNPFAAPSRSASADPFAATHVVPRTAASDADVGDGYFAIVASGPAVPADEVECNVPAIEVMVLWGERDILHVSHLSPLRPFVVGEGPSKSSGNLAAPDFRMEAAFLGATQLPIAMPEGNGVSVLVPAGATISVRRGTELRTDAQLRGGGELRQALGVAGAESYTLREDETARVTLKGFVFQVKAVKAGLPLGTGVRPDPRPFYYVGSVGGFAAALFLAISYLLPPPSMLGGDQLDVSNRYVQAMIEAREDVRPDPIPSTTGGAETTGAAAADDSGEMGARDQPRADRRSATRGDASPEDARIAPTSGADLARNNVVTDAMSTIAAMFGGGPTSSYSADGAIGSDALDAIGHLVGGSIGSSGAMGGLGPQGSGIGGGGDAHGVYGAGNGPNTIGGDRIGHGPGDLTRREPHPPRAIPISSSVAVNGGLTSEQIRRVIQRNVSQVQHCYEQGLQRNPSLAGRVTVSFMIMPTGAVSGASADSGLGDAQVGTCIASSVRRWAFPQPDPAGVVSVRFPFNLSQGGQ